MTRSLLPPMRRTVSLDTFARCGARGDFHRNRRLEYPARYSRQLSTEGTALQRYAGRFQAAEINSSFHRPHRISTWERWRDSVPDEFRFSVKVPKQITHIRRLVDCRGEVEDFVGHAQTLGDKLAVQLVQLPPSLAFDPAVAEDFFTDLAARRSARIACEPRHASWFGQEGDELLKRLRVVRVAADPSCAKPRHARAGGAASVTGGFTAHR